MFNFAMVKADILIQSK